MEQACVRGKKGKRKGKRPACSTLLGRVLGVRRSTAAWLLGSHHTRNERLMPGEETAEDVSFAGNPQTVSPSTVGPLFLRC